jgi:nitroreductase
MKISTGCCPKTEYNRNGGTKMEFNELIKERRSVRAYGAAPTHEEIVAILSDAQQAPSWKNSQTTRWYVVESPEKHEELRQALHIANQNKVVNAAMIVSTYVRNIAGFTKEEPDKKSETDGEHMILAFTMPIFSLRQKNIGYDTLIMGLRDGQKIREILAIPENEEVLSVIAIGRRGEEPTFRPRKELKEIVKFY